MDQVEYKESVSALWQRYIIAATYNRYGRQDAGTGMQEQYNPPLPQMMGFKSVDTTREDLQIRLGSTTKAEGSMRTAEIDRNTLETQISVSVNLRWQRRARVSNGLAIS